MKCKECGHESEQFEIRGSMIMTGDAIEVDGEIIVHDLWVDESETLVCCTKCGAEMNITVSEVSRAEFNSLNITTADRSLEPMSSDEKFIFPVPSASYT